MAKFCHVFPWIISNFCPPFLLWQAHPLPESFLVLLLQSTHLRASHSLTPGPFHHQLVQSAADKTIFLNFASSSTPLFERFIFLTCRVNPVTDRHVCIHTHMHTLALTNFSSFPMCFTASSKLFLLKADAADHKRNAFSGLSGDTSTDGCHACTAQVLRFLWHRFSKVKTCLWSLYYFGEMGGV